MTDTNISLTELLRNMDNFRTQVNHMILVLAAFSHDDKNLHLMNERLIALYHTLPSVETRATDDV